MPAIFIICDIITAYLLYLTANEYLKISYKQQCKTLKENKEYIETLDEDEKREIKLNADKNEDNFFLSEATIKLPPTYVFAAYLFNPYVIFNSVAMTTTVFSNMFLAIYLCALIHSKIYYLCLKFATKNIFFSCFLCFREYFYMFDIFGAIRYTDHVFSNIYFSYFVEHRKKRLL